MLAREAHDEEAHGNAMVVMRGHLGAAGWRAAEALNDEAFAIVPGLDAAGGKARQAGWKAVAILDAKTAEAVQHGTALSDDCGAGDERHTADKGQVERGPQPPPATRLGRAGYGRSTPP